MDMIKKLNKKNVAKNVGKLIVESRYSREELAEWLNVTPRVIYFWQEGKRIPNTESIYMLAQLFKVSMESILA
jgi:DNA-binding XRE family transcriptional regulator